MPPIIHDEAFNRVCEVPYKVYKEKQTNWDLRVRVVRWACRTMCKTLSTKMIPKVWSGVETIISEENANRNPHVIDLVVVTVCEDQDEEITQLCEVKQIDI